MQHDNKSYILAILNDAGLPTATAQKILEDINNKRIKELRDIIRSEIRDGNFENVDKEEFVSIAYRLMRDAVEGTAKKNLLLMVRVMKGLIDNNELKAETFNQFANMLSSLTEEEIKILGLIAQKYDNVVTIEVRRERSVDAALVELCGTKGENRELYRFYSSILQGLARTGLILINIGLGCESYEYNGDYSVTYFFEKLLKYIKQF